MDETGLPKSTRTLAAQPAAAVHFSAPHATGVPTVRHEAESAAREGGTRRGRLERMLLLARQMQQH